MPTSCMDISELKRLRDELVQLRSAADDPTRYEEIRNVADEIKELVENG